MRLEKKEGGKTVKNNHLLQWIMEDTKGAKTYTSKKQNILEAAITLFAEKGYANTATSEIAQLAGVAEGTIFRHYGTKENLLLSILVPFIKKSLPQMTEEIFTEVLAKKPHHMDEFVLALVTERYTFFKENQELFRVLMKEIIYNDELKNDVINHMSKHALARIEQVILSFQEKGEVVEIPAKIMSRTIFTTLFGYFLSRFHMMPENIFLDDEKEIDYLVQLIVNGVKRANN